MITDPNINPLIATRIQAELDAIEQAEGVRILLAVESGSRAWRFPSRDSDYDVRFLYARPATDYLTITPRRDVIERPVDAVFDVNGWDISKALGLALRPNAALLEWLCSPVRYRTAGQAPEWIRNFAHAAANPVALAHHYASLGRRSFEEIGTAGEAVRLKAYCYALRASLALAWLRAHGFAPPMDVPSLLAGMTIPATILPEITSLIARKREAMEQATTAPLPILDTWLHAGLFAPIEIADTRPTDDFGRCADSLFKSIVCETTGSSGGASCC